MDSSRDARDKTLYETDFFTWTGRQAAHLREGRYDRMEVANIADEIESLGKSQIFALRASYKRIAHLLKVMRQPEKATARWETTIDRERNTVAALLEDNPELKPKRAALSAKAYATARSEAAFEMKIDIESFPETPPFTIEKIEDHAFWPPGFPNLHAPVKSRG
jgi:hypothetical protein